MSASGTASIGAMTPLTFSPEKQYRNQRAPGVVARCSAAAYACLPPWSRQWYSALSMTVSNCRS